MNHEEMLKKLGISDSELQDFLTKYSSFLATLNPAEHAMISRSLPTMKHALESFGGKITAEQLTELFGGDSQHPAIFIGASIGKHR